MRSRLILGIGVVAFGLGGGPAGAQMICGDRTDFVHKLQTRYSKKPNGIGVTTEGRLIEVFASQEGTWTMILTRPDGRSCLVTHGEAWRDVPLAKSRARGGPGS